jgi:hypothetical protein
MTLVQEKAVSRLNDEIQASKNDALHKVGEHLIDCASKSDAFAAALSAALDEGKTLEKCWDSIVNAAKKKLNNKNGAVVDTDVWAWADDYFKVPLTAVARAPMPNRRLNLDLDALLD